MTVRGRGVLIALEGIDGAGKSTQARRLIRTLRHRGARVAAWREPVDRRLGQLAQQASIRDPLLGALYFSLDRRLGFPQLARLLETHDFVVTDRSLYSTLAYQGSALSPAHRRRIEDLQRTSTVRPDRVILLDLSVASALRRLGGRSVGLAPLERRRTLSRTAGAYRRMSRAPGWEVVRAEGPADEVAGRVLEALEAPRRFRRRRA